ncbi:unnamed protein product [Pylaiella littoralis]
MSAWRAACSAHGRTCRHRTPTTSKMWFGRRGGVGVNLPRVVSGGSTSIQQQQQRQQQQQQQQRDGGDEGRSTWGQEGWAFARDVTWVACLYHCLTAYVAEPCAVRGPSMRPTIEDGSWLLVNKMGGKSRELKLGQIVLVQSPQEPGRMVVKRIAGLPGDSVSVRPPSWDVRNSLGIEKRLEGVPEGHVWLTGDNSDNSKDSREYGSVPQALVEGVVSMRLWPYKDFGPIE